MIGTGIIELDIHGMNQYQAETLIDNRLRQVCPKGKTPTAYQIRIIHGYHGGTSLRDMIWRNYKNYDEVIRIQMGSNPGETLLILREF